MIMSIVDILDDDGIFGYISTDEALGNIDHVYCRYT